MKNLTPTSQATGLVPHHPFAVDLNKLSGSEQVRIGTAWETLAENTRRAYYAAHHQCGDWILQRGIPSLDMLTDQVFSIYIKELDAKGSAPASISVAVSAVRWIFKK